ncbi:MAG: MCE family protein [Selenomonadaceae bacterium]|nr:MCE family protein [Selenomonadaceae bacterium]
MSAEAKVGAFAVGGLMALSSAMYAVGDFNFGNSDDLTVYAGFKQVVGLEKQSAVRLSGVPVGNVAEIKNDGGGVTVTLNIKPDLKIPKASQVSVSSSGVMGEKFINIMPGKDNGNYLENGDYVYGVEETDMNTMFDGMNNVMVKVEDLLKDVQTVLGDKTFQTSVVEMSKNLKSASGHVDEFTAALERMAVGNEGNVAQMAGQMNEILAGMNRSMANVENMTANMNKFAGDPKTVEELQTTLKNISDTSKNIANMAENINKVAGDPKVAEDMKDTIHNAKNLTERADKILTKVQGASDKFSKIEVTPSVDVLYSGKNSDWNTNFNLDINSGSTEFKIGAENIGERTKLNAQVGKRFDDVGARAGIIAGKPGIALDAYAGKNVKFSAEAYDPNDAKLRLKSQFKVADSTYILGEWHDVTHKDSRAAYFGVKREF